jgi:asparagine synthase (glutamine-hydrolysing)
MPGISLVYKKNTEVLPDYKSLLDSLNHLPYYHSEVLLNNNNCFVGSNGYDAYPIVKFKIREYDIILEGKIYNRTINEIKDQLDKLLSESHFGYSYDRLARWILDSDGEFIIYMISDNSILIFNDVFGRLPLYYFEDANKLMVSRSLNFIVKCSNKVKMDSMAISQFLLLGYMLGVRTLIENVKQLRPITLLKYSNGKSEITPLYNFNFDQKDNLNKTSQDTLLELKELFSLSCRNRYRGNDENIVTLSGGLDSRLVASAMYDNKIPFKAATMVYQNGYATEEIGIAEKLCNIYKVKLDKIQVIPPKGAQVLELLKLKEGMNSLATSPIIPFYYELINTYKKYLTYITGDNGDKIIFTLDRPPINFKAIDNLVQFVLNENSVIPVGSITQITGITKEEISEEIKTILLNFPEKNLFQKYVHLRSIEKPFKYAFQGEDRHRSYFWNSSPFWTYGFFNYLMNCSDLSKKKHRIFAGLLNSYSKEATDLTYTNFHSSVNSIKGKIFMNMVYNIYPLIPTLGKKILKNNFFKGNPKVDDNFMLYSIMNAQKDKTSEISSYINTDKLMDLGLNKVSVYNLFTVTSAIEYLLINNSSLQNYSNNEFN